MSRQIDGTRRFIHALATMILVACSLPCTMGNDASSAAAVRRRAKALEEASATGGGAAGGAVLPVVDERPSPGLLLERGTALLRGGNSKDAVGVLDAAISAWEQEVGTSTNRTQQQYWYSSAQSLQQQTGDIVLQ